MSNTALGAALTIDDSVLAKIQEAEKKIIRLEQTTRTSADKIAKSFRNAGDVGIQYFIDKLKLAQTELGKINVPKIDFGQSINFRQVSQQATLLAESVAKASVALNQYYSSTQKSNRKTTISTEEERKAYIQKYEMSKKMFDQIERNEKRAIKAAENEAKAQEQAAQRIIAAARRQYAEQAKLYQQQNLKQNTTYQGALSFAESASTINRRTKAIQYLTRARAQLSSTDANYTQKLKALNDAIKRMNTENEKAVQGARNLAKQHSNLMNTSDQLMRKLALIFSVSQIQGYVNKLIQVRGEFELQNTALASILQNKDQADKLFGQITELAVKSPFTVKELTTYTKSLAAYQFQYEELYDTTKRLADVASGLGVDMQRLILAVGQVKAAGYLRGTETRQFTEAGFNILGELAKYYSELENRIVSVGEVQERQFKRMIAFQDVEAVFKRVTDAGGMFYQMQEKQAETLAGQMSNLKDSIDLMFNSIGKANDGTLKDMVALVRSFIENWQEVVFVLEPAVAALGAWKALTLLASIGNKKFALSLYAIATNAKTATASISLMTRATTMLAAVGRGLMSVFAIAIPVALIAGVMELYRVTTKASREANELKKALDGISNEGFVRASELISNFKVLAEKAVEAADGSKEQQAALEELQRTYKDILPERELEIDKLRELKGEYDNITTAIYSKIEAQIKEKQIQEVSNTYGTAASEAMDALAKRLTDYNISLSTAKTITNEFKKMLEQGMIKDANQAKTELENLIRLFSGQYASLGEENIWQKLGWTTGVDVIGEIEDAFDAFTRFNNEVKRLEGEPITPFRIGGGTEMYQSLKEELENIAKFKEDWEKQNKDKFKFKVEFNEESKNALIAEYQKFIADLNNRISSGQIKQGDILSANLIIEEAQKAIEKLDVSPQIAQVNDLRVEFSKLYDIDFEKFNFTKMLEGQGFNDFIKRLDEGIQGYQEIIDVFDEAAKQGIEVPAMQQWALLQGKTIEEIRAFVPVLKEYREELALVNKEQGGGRATNKSLQILKDRIALIKKAGEEYEKYLKYYDEEAAKQKVVNNMRTAASNLGIEDTIVSMDFDVSGVIKAISSLANIAGTEGAKALEEALYPLKNERDINFREKGLDEIRQKVEEIFQSYQFSLELNTSGIDPSSFKEMLKSLGADEVTLDSIGLSVTSLSELQEKTRAKIAELRKQGGEEQIKEAEKLQAKLTEIEVKEAKSKLNELAKLREKYNNKEVLIVQKQSTVNTWISEKANLEEQKRMGKEVNDELIELLDLRIRAGEEEILQLKSEAIQLTSFWRQLFGDLSDVSVSSLRKLRDTSEDILSNAKEIVIGGEVKGYTSSYTDKDGIEKQVTLTIEQYQRLLKSTKSVTQEIENKNPFIALFDTISKGLGEGESMLDYIENLQGSISGSIGVAKDLANNLAAIFNADEDAQELVNNVMSLVEGTAELGTGVARIVGGDIIGGAVSAISGLATVMQSIFTISDNKKEKEIQRQIEQVENLQKAYEKLEKAINDAYSIDTLEASTDQAIANLEEQNRKYQQMIAAEEDKKKTDDDRIKGWQDAMEANEEAIAELVKNQISTVTAGILDDGLSAADAFVDAWLEAFQETGEGLQGLEDNFNEMLLNMIKRQAAMSIVSPLIENMQKELEKYINKDDTELTIDEANKFAEYVRDQFPEVSAALENLFNGLKDVGLEFGGGDTMSELSRGISSITEETAQALEALLNSMRYFVSDSNLQLRNILTALTAPAPENPYLLELKAQTEQLRLMNSLWSRIVKSENGVIALNVRMK